MTGNEEVGLFQISLVYPKTSFEKNFENCYQNMISNTENMNLNELQDYLHNKLTKSNKDLEDVFTGLVYALLTKPDKSSRMFHVMASISKDTTSYLIKTVSMIVCDMFDRLSSVSLCQIFWLLEELIIAEVKEVSKLVISVLRTIRIGSFSKSNIWVCQRFFDIVNKNRVFLSRNFDILVPVVLYFMKLLRDHHNCNMAQFVDHEIEFCLTLIKNNINVFIEVGNEFGRLVQNLLIFDGFKEFWESLQQQHSTHNLMSSQLFLIMSNKTSYRHISSQIHYDLDKKINFLLTQARFSQFHFYLEWLHKQHFMSPESFAAMPSVIRYICSVIHPSNDIICSDIVQRWALIDSLLHTVKDDMCILSECRLSLFYDWIFFNEQPESIMNIEPAILIIYHSFESNPDTALSLIDFLCHSVKEMLPAMTDFIQKCANNALISLMEMKVILSLEPLLNFLLKYPNVHQRFVSVFAQTLTHYKLNELTDSKNSEVSQKQIKSGCRQKDSTKIIENFFSGFDEAVSLKNIPKKNTDITLLREFHCLNDKKIEDCLVMVKNATSIDGNVDLAVKEIFDFYISKVTNESAQEHIAVCLAYARVLDYELFLSSDTQQIIIYTIIKNLLRSESNWNHASKLMQTWSYIDSRFNYILLYYVCMNNRIKFYMLFINNSVETFQKHMLCCYECDVLAFEKIIPFCLKEFTKPILSNVELMECLLFSMNPANCVEITETLTVLQFKKALKLDSTIVNALLEKSRSEEWDHFTESMFFGLLRVFRYMIDVETLVQHLESLNYNIGPNILSYLMNVTPNAKLVTSIIMKNMEKFSFVLMHWLMKFPSLTISTINQWVQQTKDFNTLCEFFVNALNGSSNEAIRNKFKSETGFTQLLNTIQANSELIKNKHTKDCFAKLEDVINKTQDPARKRKITFDHDKTGNDKRI